MNQFQTRLFNYIAMGILAAVMMIAATAARGAVTEQDLATLGTTTSLSIKANAPGEISLPWILGRMAISLGVVFGLMAMVIWAARKYLPQSARAGARSGPIEVLNTKPLGQRRSLMLVRVQGKTLLLGVTPQSIQTLSELDDDNEPASWQDAALESGMSDEG